MLFVVMSDLRLYIWKGCGYVEERVKISRVTFSFLINTEPSVVSNLHFVSKIYLCWFLCFIPKSKHFSASLAENLLQLAKLKPIPP